MYPRSIDLGPNWFAVVMGTGIVAIAAHGLPVQVPGQAVFALAVWALAAVLLLVLLAVIAGGWVAQPQRFRTHLAHPVMAHFFGALPMAMLTVGAGALLVARDVLGLPAVLLIDGVLWTLGTVTGLVCAVVVPYWACTHHLNAPGSAFGGWLMPVVPPMVSATTGGFLAPYVPAGQPRLTLLLLCGVMFGLSLIASLLVLAQLWNRLLHHGIGPAGLVPTLWIVLGPIGQSCTAAVVLGTAARAAVPGVAGEIAGVAGVLYAVAGIGFALLWLVFVGVVTLRAARSGLPFSLTWWSFTFPVGTVVTGVSQLAAHTGLGLLAGLAAGLFVLLIITWTTVFTRTVHGVRTGALLPPAPVVTVPLVYAI